MLRVTRPLHPLLANTASLHAAGPNPFPVRIFHAHHPINASRYSSDAQHTSTAKVVVAALGAAVGLLSANVVFADRPSPSLSPNANVNVNSTTSPSRDAYKFLICGGGVAAQEALKVFVEEKQTADLLVVSPEWRTSRPPLHLEGRHYLSTPAMNASTTADASLAIPANADNISSNENSDSSLSLYGVFRTVSSLSPWSASSQTQIQSHPDNVPAFDTGLAEVVLGRRVETIDPQARVATLDDGARVSFDKVLIAVGCEAPRIPLGRVVSPSAARFVGTAQSATDWAAISRVLDSHGDHPPHFTIVGGDWMSAIVGARLVRMGGSVTFAYADPCFLARCLPKYVARDVRARLEWLAEQHESENGVDLLAYSAIRFVTARTALHPRSYNPVRRDGSQETYAPQAHTKQEAEVHAGSVFDAFSIVDFRTDCVLFVPTGGHVERVDVSGVTDIPSLHHGHPPQAHQPTISSNSNNGLPDNGAIATNAQLSAASDVYVAGAATGRWGAAHAAKTGRHAAHNMLGARQALEPAPARAFIDLSDLNLGVTTVGRVDGSLESFGYFASARHGNDSVSGSSSCGGRFTCGAVFCVAGAPPRFRGDGLRLVITGVALWNGVPKSDTRALKDVDEAARHAEQILQLPPMTRTDLEQVMDAYVRKFVDITDFEDVVISRQTEDVQSARTSTTILSSSDLETGLEINSETEIKMKGKREKGESRNNSDGLDPDNTEPEQLGKATHRPFISKRPVPGVVWKRHLPARRVTLRSDELLWVENEWVGAASPTNQNDAKAQAYADLLRRSAGG